MLVPVLSFLLLKQYAEGKKPGTAFLGLAVLAGAAVCYTLQLCIMWAIEKKQ